MTTAPLMAGRTYALFSEPSSFSIWERGAPVPSAVFPRSDLGWQQAVARFGVLEPAGAVTADFAPYFAPAQPEGNGVGMAGGIMGIVALTLSMFPLFGVVFGFLLGPIAVVLSACGLGKQPRNFAFVGLVLGLLAIGLKMIPGYRWL